MAGGRLTYESIARDLLSHLPAGAAEDLRLEDPATAVECNFEPVRVRAMPAAGLFDAEVCSTDGFYDHSIDPNGPWIFYADDVTTARARFTIVHEVGHHLINAVASHLLDAIDSLGSDAQATEEQVCHAFAGLVLVPDHLVGGGPVTPARIVEVKEESAASWEATIVRLISSTTEPQAAILLRDPGVVAFGVASRSLGSGWWNRGAVVDGHGPLRSALGRRIVAQPDTYRYGLAGSQRMFVDSVPVHARLAVAVFSRQPSDGHFEVLVDPEPTWKDDATMCLFCPGERGTGWCETCSARFCDECGRCGCAGAPATGQRCKVCNRQPRRPGADMCRTCEADFS